MTHSDSRVAVYTGSFDPVTLGHLNVIERAARLGRGADGLERKSVSERKRRANRENADKSTGAKTVQGKERSKMNALKHGFPDGRRGTLKVSLHSPAPGQLLLSVADDGVGFPPGFDWNQARSLGLRMVHDLARQIRGTLEVRQNGGTLFALSFPVAKPRHKPLLQP